jgi:hypothetical protein
MTTNPQGALHDAKLAEGMYVVTAAIRGHMFCVAIRRDDLQYRMTVAPNGSHGVHDTLISS